MYYFTSTINQLFFSADIPEGEKNKMIKYLEFLDESGVGDIIHDEVAKDYSKGGRTPYDPYRLFMLFQNILVPYVKLKKAFLLILDLCFS